MDETMIRMMQLGQQGYSCSQIMMLLGLQVRAESNPGLVRAMAGLAYGCGSGHGTCGVLTGGCCLLALYAGKGSDEETESDRMGLMSCDAIVGESGPEASRQRCGTILAATYAKVMEILSTNGIDPSSV